MYTSYHVCHIDIGKDVWAASHDYSHVLFSSNQILSFIYPTLPPFIPTNHVTWDCEEIV